MRQLPNDEMPRDLVDAFWGAAPLKVAEAHFPSQQSLLQAYATLQSTVFNKEAVRPETCDLCDAAAATCWVETEWEARWKWHPFRILWILPMLLLIATHLHIFFGRSRVDLVEVVPVTTWYVTCTACRKQSAWRSACTVMLLTIIYVSAIFLCGAILFTGALLVGACFGAWNLDFGTWQTITSFASSAILFALLLAVARPAAWRFSIPPAIRRKVKSPFYCTGFEIHKPWVRDLT